MKYCAFSNNKKVLNISSEELVSNVHTNYYNSENLQGFYSDFQQYEPKTHKILKFFKKISR